MLIFCAGAVGKDIESTRLGDAPVLSTGLGVADFNKDWLVKPCKLLVNRDNGAAMPDISLLSWLPAAA
ncbi:hypothetical protein OS11_45600 [Dickeya oryzae]